MSKRFENRIAIVTGAGQGIGEEYARRLSAEGAAVAVAEINKAQGERVAGEINDGGGKALFVHADVGDPDSCTAMTKEVAGKLGGIDYLVNNAAIFHDMNTAPLMDVDLDYYNKFMNVNLNGALHCTRACVPYMKERGGGAIVNQSSTASWMAAGYYGLAKAATNSLTVCLAYELGDHGIRVNAIAPGPTDTDALRKQASAVIEPMVAALALKRLGQPSDQAGGVLFLLSDEAAWVTGHILAVDGGQIVRI